MVSGNIFKVLVLDMQPIEPPVGGGRIRLLGLYHGLGKNLPARYIGSYDWPGPCFRRHNLAEGLEEIDIPLSQTHFGVSERWKTFAGGRTVIDAAFPLMAHLSKDFVRGIRPAVWRADIVVISHPWVYPAIRDDLQGERQLIVYDSHNFEGMLRAEMLDDGGFGSEIVKQVIATELELAHRADLILTCSEEDLTLFKNIYSVHEGKMRVIANGVFSKSLIPPTNGAKKEAKDALGLKGRTAIFIGSAYDPNIEAVDFICNKLAPFLPEVTFVVCGGVCEAAEVTAMKNKSMGNVHFAGYVDEKEKLIYLHAADLAVNPMFSGSGTNIKMFDYMAAGLPIVSTGIGARGIDLSPDPELVVAEKDFFVDSIISIIADEGLAGKLGNRARALVEEKYSWESISPNLGCTLAEALNKKRTTEDLSEDKKRLAQAAPMSSDGRYGRVRVDLDKMGILTSWGVRCGIAEYSRHLIDALVARNIKCHVLANSDSESESCEPADGGSPYLIVEHSWQYGNIKSEDIVEKCLRDHIKHLNIQYHHGFFREESLVDIAKHCGHARIGLSVTLHNTRDLSVSCLTKLGEVGAKLLLHSHAEKSRLSRAGVKNLFHIPFGVLDVADEDAMIARRRLYISTSPVVGCFGFMRPHKGLLEMIQATAILRDLFPDIFLFSLNSLYPSADSARYLSECREQIARLNLDKHVRLITDFLDIEQVINDLHACDVIVLPYHQSNEGASASAHTVIASRRPLITTRQDIFSDIAAVVYKVERSEAAIVAAGVANVLSSPMLLRSLKEKAERYTRNNSWESVAETYLDHLLT